MITILTPTYNRAYRLDTLYQSLIRQTCKDFEWIIVDDGSTDRTRALFEGWNKDGISIQYIYKENGGKHTAVNVGVNVAKGDFIFIVDSDDYLIENAIEKVCDWTREIEDDANFAGVSGLRGYSRDKCIGEHPKKDYVDCTNLERKKYSLRGDKAEIYRRSILLKYPFPEFPGEHFLPEDIVWNAIAADEYKLRWHNEIIYIGEYLPDGLTLGGQEQDKRINCFEGYTAREQLNVKVQSGFERYMELGRYIDLVKKKEINKCSSWIKDKLKIGAIVYACGYVCYCMRKYGKILLRRN